MNSPSRKRSREDGDSDDGKSFSRRPPLTSSHKLERDDSKFHLIVMVTGSIAVIKLHEIVQRLYDKCGEGKIIIKIVATENALRLWETQDIDLDETIYEDRDEWCMWRQRGDPVLHIELRKWADALLIAPLDANTMAKIACGMCDNLATSLVRAWDLSKPCYFAPAMNTHMWENPLTVGQRNTLRTILQFKEICPIAKELICGDNGQGAMAEPASIVSLIAALVRDRFAIKTAVN